jgi:hypothetical protein
MGEGRKPEHMRNYFKRNAKLVLYISGPSALAGAAISSYQGYAAGRLTLWNVGNGIVDGFLIVFLLSAYTLLISEILLKKWLRRLGFGPLLLLNSSAYVFLILLGRALGRYIMEYDALILLPIATEIERLHTVQAFGAALIASIIVNFLYQTGRLLGPHALANFVTGRYRTAAEDVLISAELVALLDLPDTVERHDLGPVNLRGKHEPVGLCALRMR